MKLDKKRENEKKVVGKMIDIYSRSHQEEFLKCIELKEYAYKRIDCCPFMESKTFCSSCKVHCYQNEMRQQIKKVMRYSGPRMLLYHPILTLSHTLEDLRRKRK